MGMKTQAGVLVLADISGFTAFVTATELEHGPQIIGTLLEVLRDIRKRGNSDRLPTQLSIGGRVAFRLASATRRR
jgi:hypothetical protein